MASLADQPTDILVKLAEKLKDRRNNLYPQEDLMDREDSFDPDVFHGDDVTHNLGSEHKIDKSVN